MQRSTMLRRLPARARKFRAGARFEPGLPRRRTNAFFFPISRLRIALRFAGNIKSGVPLQERRLVDYCRVIS